MIKTLSGIRFYLFLIIFIRHFDYINQTHFLFPSFKTLHFVFFAVTFFFILSGFCIALGYSEKFQELKKETILEFYKKRFIKIYPLYLLTGLVFLFFHFKDIDTKWAKHFLLYLIHYIFIQFTSKFTLINTKAEIIIAFCLLLFATITTSIGYKKLQSFIEHKITRKYSN